MIFNRFNRICCLGILLLVFNVFFFFEFVNSSRESCYFYYATGDSLGHGDAMATVGAARYGAAMLR